MSESDEYMKALEIQRRNFEAQFGSIEDLGYKDKSKITPESDDDEEKSGVDMGSDSDSDGVERDEMSDAMSSDEVDEEDSDDVANEGSKQKNHVNKPVVKVVRLSDKYSSLPKTTLSKADKKILQSGRAATLAEISRQEEIASKMTKKQKQQATKEDEDNVENDLKLQRLLAESHILAEQQQYSGADLTLATIDFDGPTGKSRQRTLDSRIRTIASTNSSTGGLPKKLEKMPMSMRKGMINKYEKKVTKYEQDAKDAGIVLSKVKKGERRQINMGKGATSITDRIGSGKKSLNRIRDRGLKINSVGRSTRNGLIISKDEIERINGAGKRGGKGGKRGGRR